MAVKSSAHFRVRGQSVGEATSGVKRCLESIPMMDYGVRTWEVKADSNGTIMIVLSMESNDPDTADADAERASEEILRQLSGSPDRPHWHERQRELVLS